MGEIKKPKNQRADIWTGYIITKSGKKIPRLMREKEAKIFSSETGKAVFKGMKIWELREL